MKEGSPTSAAALSVPPAKGGLERYASGLGARSGLFAGLLLIPIANGLAGRVIEASRELGWGAIPAGFNVSAIVWLAVIASLRLVLRADGGQIKSMDLAVGAAVLCLTAVPVPKLSWAALAMGPGAAARLL